MNDKRENKFRIKKSGSDVKASESIAQNSKIILKHCAFLAKLGKYEVRDINNLEGPRVIFPTSQLTNE